MEYLQCETTLFMSSPIKLLKWIIQEAQVCMILVEPILRIEEGGLTLTLIRF